MSIPGWYGIVRVSQESNDTQTREVELWSSRDDPGIVRVSQESQDLRNMSKHVQCNLGNLLRIVDILQGYWTSLCSTPQVIKTVELDEHLVGCELFHTFSPHV